MTEGNRYKYYYILGHLTREDDKRIIKSPKKKETINLKTLKKVIEKIFSKGEKK